MQATDIVASGVQPSLSERGGRVDPIRSTPERTFLAVNPPVRAIPSSDTGRLIYSPFVNPMFDNVLCTPIDNAIFASLDATVGVPRAGPRSEDIVSSSLDLVTSVATQLMEAT